VDEEDDGGDEEEKDEASKAGAAAAERLFGHGCCGRRYWDSACGSALRCALRPCMRAWCGRCVVDRCTCTAPSAGSCWRGCATATQRCMPT
jgi:hypothetical protein